MWQFLKAVWRRLTTFRQSPEEDVLLKVARLVDDYVRRKGYPPVKLWLSAADEATLQSQYPDCSSRTPILRRLRRVCKVWVDFGTAETRVGCPFFDALDDYLRLEPTPRAEPSPVAKLPVVQFACIDPHLNPSALDFPAPAEPPYYSAALKAYLHPDLPTVIEEGGA